jgi:hypothetical protein
MLRLLVKQKWSNWLVRYSTQSGTRFHLPRAVLRTSTEVVEEFNALSRRQMILHVLATHVLNGRLVQKSVIDLVEGQFHVKVRNTPARSKIY